MTTRLRRVAVAIAVLAGTLVAQAAGAQETASLPPLTQPVTDIANVIDSSSADAIDRLSRTLQAATGDVVAVVTVPTIEPYADINEYAVKLFQNGGRGIGTRGQDNGVLILLAVKERRVRVEVGYGLEQWITDGFAGQVSREDMAPAFRNGQYGVGLSNGSARIVSRIAEGRNVTLTGVDLPRSARARQVQIPLWAIILFFIMIVLLSRSAGGPGRGMKRWGRTGRWSSGVGPFGGGFGGGYGGGGWGGSGGFGGGFGGFGGGRSGGGGGGASW